MMATVPHVISGLGLRKFQADGFLLTRVYKKLLLNSHIWSWGSVTIPILHMRLSLVQQGRTFGKINLWKYTYCRER